jgi:hypothetical protein
MAKPRTAENVGKNVRETPPQSTGILAQGVENSYKPDEKPPPWNAAETTPGQPAEKTTRIPLDTLADEVRHTSSSSTTTMLQSACPGEAGIAAAGTDAVV